jgi:hypothetical protein
MGMENFKAQPEKMVSRSELVARAAELRAGKSEITRQLNEGDKRTQHANLSPELQRVRTEAQTSLQREYALLDEELDAVEARLAKMPPEDPEMAWSDPSHHGGTDRRS